MKNVPATYLLFLIFSLLAITNGKAQTVYTIPWAVQQPQWVFPIWFEDGDGRIDTVYIGYDSLSTNGYIDTLGQTIYPDTIFGEYLFAADTNDFNMDFRQGNYCLNPSECRIQKAQIGSINGNANIISDYFTIRSLRRVKLPVKMKWDRNLLNSEELPFLLNNNIHKAQGYALFYDTFSFFPNLPMCSTSLRVLMSDSCKYTWDTDCLASDSIMWDVTFTDSTYFNVSIRIEKWNGNPNGVGLNELNLNSIIVSNSGNGLLEINLNDTEMKELKIYDVLGSIVFHKTIESQLFKVNTNNFADNVYFLNFSNQQQTITKKIIVQN